MPLDFPNSPSNGDTYNAGGKTWSYNGSVWVLVGVSVSATPEDGSITTAKIAAGAVTAAKLGNDISLTPADGSITQAKLAASLSGVTVTTTANRSAAVPSPFTGQTIFLTDVKRMQVWDGSVWMFITNGAPGAPTSLSATPLSTTSVSVAFTTGALAGSAITNYKYAYSSNAGSTYSEFAALDPVDITSPVVISGLVGTTTYLIKLRAVSDFGDSVDSSPVSVTTLTSPSAPTSLSATGFYLMAQIAFTPGADGGSPITNYEYALSTNSGANYGAFTALSPADTTSPIDITGLANNTTYLIKLRAVNANGAGIESSAVSVTTNQNTIVNYLVVAGGGGGGLRHAGGGGAGGLRSTVTTTGGGGILETAATIAVNTNYSISVGGGGSAQSSGIASFFSTISTVGGGRGGDNANAGSTGGSGGGGANGGAGGAGTANQGFGGSTTTFGGAGGGAGQAGTTSGGAGYNGGAGVAVNITGSSVSYAGGGGGGGATQGGAAGLGGTGGGGAGGYNTTGNNGTANTGGGAGGGGADGGSSYNGGAGGSGVIILRYLSSFTITVGAGLTASHTNADAGGGNRYTRITAGSGNVSWA